MLLKESKTGIAYKKSSIQVDAPSDIADMVIEFGKKYAADAVIFTAADGSKGREDEIHTTILYGLTDEPEEIIPKLKELLKGVTSFKIKLGKVSRFTSDPNYDVLKIDLISDGLTSLNQLIKDNFDYVSDFDTFRPHITIAYLRKGFLVDLSGHTNFVGTSFTVHAVTFSGKAKSGKTVIHLKD
jgi:2'-5' RNA ligase